jgi:hypothetical protein
MRRKTSKRGKSRRGKSSRFKFMRGAKREKARVIARDKELD